MICVAEFRSEIGRTCLIRFTEFKSPRTVSLGHHSRAGNLLLNLELSRMLQCLVFRRLAVFCHIPRIALPASHPARELLLIAARRQFVPSIFDRRDADASCEPPSCDESSPLKALPGSHPAAAFILTSQSSIRSTFPTHTVGPGVLREVWRGSRTDQRHLPPAPSQYREALRPEMSSGRRQSTGNHRRNRGVWRWDGF